MAKFSLDREQWLTEAANMIRSDLIIPNLPNGHVIPHPFRVSVGYPPRSTARSRTIAVCIKAEASGDSHNEIFITPSLADNIKVLEALAHELVHQADDCQSGHQHFFAAMARKIGLEGQLTATHAGAELVEYLNMIVDSLGDIPHAAINLDIAKKKQGTRLLKVECKSCGFNFSLSRKQFDRMLTNTCNVCGNMHDHGLHQVARNPK
jgi:hypothetical protein